MADTAADILVDTLHDWGVEVVFGLPGDGINGIMEALRTRQDEIRFVQVRHEESAAFMACGYAKYTGQARRLPGHLGPGRHPPAQRPLRRQAGRAAGAGHHRPPLPRPDRHPRPAGRRPRPRLRGRGGLQHAGHGAGARRERGRPGLPHGAGLPRRGAHQLPGRPPGAGRRTSARSATCPSHTSDVLRPRRARCRPRTTCAGRPTILNAGKKVAILAGRGALGRDRRAGAAGRDAGGADRQGAAGQGRRARRQPLHHRRHRPARHAAVAGGAGGVRHAAAWSAPRSPTSSSYPSRARRAACRSTSTRRASACATRSRSAWSATAAARCRRCCRCSQRNEDRALPRAGPGGHEGVAGADGGARHAARTRR